MVDTESLKAAGLIKKVGDGVKVLGDGELTKKLTVKAAAFSTPPPDRAFWPLWPLPAVLPQPEP